MRDVRETRDAAPIPATRARCLMVYPWPLDHPIGSRVVLLAYARALRAMGVRVDCFAPQRVPVMASEDGYLGVFDRVFTPPSPRDEAARRLAESGELLQDRGLPDPFGRDTTALMSAALLAASGGYDLVGVHYTRCHSIVRALPAGPRRILFTHELDSEVLRQEEALGGPPAVYTIHDEASRMEAFDLVTAVGPHDLARLRQAGPALPLVEAPFCADVRPVRASEHGGRPTLLLASSNARFHQASFEWFWRYVWPAVRDTVQLIITGSISDFARRLGARADDHVSVRGIVDSLDAVYESTDIVVAPYCYGGGIKTKVIEAIALGLPVVTSSAGLTNTRLVAGRHVMVADDAAGFAGAIRALAQSRNLRMRMSRGGLVYTAQHHDEGTAYGPLQRAVAALLARRPAPPTSPPHTPTVALLERAVPEVVRRARAMGVKRVAIYGAGSHTSLLLPVWGIHAGPTPVAVLTSAPEARRSLDGLPIVAADAFDPSSVDGIVLSSHAYEEELARACRVRWPALPTFAIWRPAMDDGLAPKPDTDPARYGCGPVIPEAIRRLALDLVEEERVA